MKRIFEIIWDILTASIYYMAWTWLIVIAVVIIWAALMYLRAEVAKQVIAENNALKTLDREENV